MFVAEGAAGASVIDRYLLGAGDPGAAVLRRLDRGLGDAAAGHRAAARVDGRRRRCWSLYGGVSVATTLSLSSLRTTLAYHEDFHEGLAAALSQPARARGAEALPAGVAAGQQADPRRALDPRQRRPARHRRAQPGARRRRDRARTSWRIGCARGSVAVYPLGSAVFFEAIVDVGDDPRDQVPQAGYHRIYTSRYYAVYDNC